MLNSAFRLGSTSYVYPGDLLYNIERLAGQVDDVELVLFELASGESNLPSLAVVKQMATLAARHQLTFTVHLPYDLRASPTGVHPSLHMAKRVIQLMSPLLPHAYIFHLEGAGIEQPDWSDQASRAVEALLPLVDTPQQLALENLENYALDHLLPIFARFPICRTVDIGHLWKAGCDPLPVLNDWLPHASVVHLHGMAEQDHQSLAVMPLEQLRPIVQRLCTWPGVLTLEVFEADFFTSRAVLEQLVTSPV
jgi:sugar phosphate isomerase/epimerase